jgi:Amt family ammonium transporter
MLEYGCGNLNSSGQVVSTTAATYATAKGTCVPFSVNGLMYTGSAHQLWEQFRAALFVIFWSALITFILMKLIGLVLRGTRYKDEILEIGDLAIHDEEAFPEAPLAERVGGGGPGAGGFELSGVGGSTPPGFEDPPPVGSGTESTT